MDALDQFRASQDKYPVDYVVKHIQNIATAAIAVETPCAVQMVYRIIIAIHDSVLEVC